MISELEIKQNKQRFIGLLSSVKREGMQNLIDWLEKTDFYVAPSSASYHNNCKGGLCAHSLNVYDAAKKIEENIFPLTKREWENKYTQDELIVSCLLHDLCKVGFYHPKEKFWKDESAPYGQQWKRYEGYEIKDKLPLGHGEKSVIMAQQFIKLTFQEMLAIRWHMNFFNPASQIDSYQKVSFADAVGKWPLVSVVGMADVFASFIIEDIFDLKHL